jgi:hypothetical protein
MIFCGDRPTLGDRPPPAPIFAIVPSGRITRFGKLAVFNGHGTFYKG